MMLSEQNVDQVWNPTYLFRFMLCDCVGKCDPRGAWPVGQAPNTLGFICYFSMVESGRLPNLNHCFSTSRFDLLYVHATSGYQNYASADYKDCTDDVEDCGTDATGGRKLCTRVILNFDCCIRV